ncbi:MAG: TPM domain-containing protein [Ignavibacteria bacterium]|nr:TPM domain-containing protein [Ignavibacteria bacterium]
MKLSKHILLFLFLSAAQFSYSQNQNSGTLSDNPVQLRNFVTDETGILNPSQLSALNNKLLSFEKTTSNQVIVYIIGSLKGESLEDVSIRLAEKNKIGKKDKNNGVLLLIVKDDRKIRIEVGYGLEGALTDAACSGIIRNEITPQFKKGMYYEGINKGVDAIIATTKGEYTADKNSDNTNISCCFGMPVFVIIIFGLIFMFIFTSFIRSLFGVGRSVYSGSNKWGSGWSGGSWGSGSSHGSSGGFGGFSGGGGSFGGGGASGSW